MAREVEAKHVSRALGAATALASPVVMSLGRLGLVVGLAVLLGVMLTCAVVELRAVRAQR